MIRNRDGKKITALLLGAASMLAVAAPAAPVRAASIILAEVSGSNSGSGLSSGFAGATEEFAVLSLAYGFNSFSGGTQPWGLDIDLQLGADIQWTLGSSGVYDFNAINSADFLGVASRLTNGVTEDLSVGRLPFYSKPGSGLSFSGSFGTGPEDGMLGHSPDLQGSSIDFIRLVVDRVFIEATSYDTYGTLEWDLQAKWQIWGTAPIPEPSGLLLFSTGMLLVGRATRRRPAA